MVELPADPTEQLRVEKMHLLKADCDIEEGCKRLRSQQELLSALQDAGRDTTQAERLVQLLQNTLLEWERHRTLIEERVSYLERKACPEGFTDSRHAGPS